MIWITILEIVLACSLMVAQIYFIIKFFEYREERQNFMQLLADYLRNYAENTTIKRLQKEEGKY